MDPDPYLWLMDTNADPGGPKIYRSYGSGSGSGCRSGSTTLAKKELKGPGPDPRAGDKSWWSHEPARTPPQGWGSDQSWNQQAMLRIQDVYPGSWFLPIPDPRSRIPDLGSRIQKQQQKRGWKKLAINFTNLKIILFLTFQKIIELFTQKIVTKLSKIWVWDPTSGP